MTRNASPKSRPKAPPVKPSCATCIHSFDKVFDKEGDPEFVPQGFCRRYPPTLKIDGISGAFPPVRLDWWCGEYRDAAKT